MFSEQHNITKRALTTAHIPSRLEQSDRDQIERLWLHGSQVICLCGMKTVQTYLLLCTEPVQPKNLGKLLQQLRRGRRRSIAAFHQVIGSNNFLNDLLLLLLLFITIISS